MQEQAIYPAAMTHESLWFTIDEVVRANNWFTSGHNDCVISYKHFFDCLLAGDEAFHGLLSVQVNYTHHFIPIGRKHVIPVLLHANDRDRVCELKDVVAYTREYVPLSHSAVIC